MNANVSTNRYVIVYGTKGNFNSLTFHMNFDIYLLNTNVQHRKTFVLL